MGCGYMLFLVFPFAFALFRCLTFARKEVAVEAVIQPAKQRVGVVAVSQDVSESAVLLRKLPIQATLKKRVVQEWPPLAVLPLKEELHEDQSCQQIVADRCWNIVPQQFFANIAKVLQQP